MSYCWPGTHSSIPDGYPIETLIKTVDKIKIQARERNFNSFIFAFSGGEPTLFKAYLDLIYHISSDADNCDSQTVHLTTNLSPGFKYFEKLIQALSKLQGKHVIASYHNEFANKELFADKVSFLQEHGIPVLINIVMVPDRFESIWTDALYFNSKNFNINLIPQRSGQELILGWTDSMKKRLKEGFPNSKLNYPLLKNPNKRDEGKERRKILPSIRDFKNKKARINFNDYDMELTDSKGSIYFVDRAERLNSLNFNKFKGWECSAGYRSLIIDRAGYVKRGHSCNTETLGHIETDFKLFQKHKPCITSGSCSCGADIMIPKIKRDS